MNKPEQFTRYVDPTGEFTNRELQFGSWYVRHRLLLGKIGLGVLIVWCVVTMGFSLWKGVEYLAFGYFDDQDLQAQQVAGFQNYTAIQDRFRAKALQFQSAEVFQGSKDRYDFVAVATNPNENFLATVRFKYTYTGGETAPFEQTILPGQEQFLLALGQELTFSPRSVSLVVEDIGFVRADPHVYKNPVGYTTDRLNFSLFSVSSTPATQDIPTRVEFTVENKTAYDFWEPTMVVEMLENGIRQGVYRVRFEQFRSGEMRRAEVRPLFVNSVDSIRLFPDINVFDQTVFMPIDG